MIYISFSFFKNGNNSLLGVNLIPRIVWLLFKFKSFEFPYFYFYFKSLFYSPKNLFQYYPFLIEWESNIFFIYETCEEKQQNNNNDNSCCIYKSIFSHVINSGNRKKSNKLQSLFFCYGIDRKEMFLMLIICPLFIISMLIICGNWYFWSLYQRIENIFASWGD